MKASSYSGLKMGNTRWDLGICLVFICLILVTMADKHVGGGNVTKASCSEQERLALVKFKHSIIDANGMLSSWGASNDCCRWERVGCDDVTGRVVSLHLRRSVTGRDDYYADDGYMSQIDWLDEAYNNPDVFLEDYYLTGDGVNSCLAELVNLKHLDLSGNYFRYSQIPEFIGSFKQLRYLNLSGASFSGNIPHQIGNLSNLEVLDLSSSSQELMTDDMPWISGLSKLEHLDLSEVSFSTTKGLHNLLYTVPSLLNLTLSKCGLSMDYLGSHRLNSSRKRANLKHLDLSQNYFIDKHNGLLLNMTSLAFLDLSWNDLSTTWSLQNLINTIPSVLELRLSGSKLSLSHTHHNFSEHSKIQHLDLSLNEIEGKFPSVLTNMSSLLSIDLSGNTLNLSIPLMPNLLKLDISGNNFTRIEHVGIWRQCHLKELIVSYNNLEGEMIGPSTNVSECAQNALEILQLDHNNLKCSIPESLGRLTNLRRLDLSYNEFTGPIPEVLGKLRSLQRLHLSFNHLIGAIPKFHGQLTVLSLAYNQLSGYIPESLGRLTALTHVFLQSNRFTGPIPISLGSLTSLRMLSVSSNLLNGTIPNSIGQLTKLLALDISYNSLQGVVSEDHFANLSMLKYLNANYNKKLLFNISHEWIPPFQLVVVRLSSCKIEDGFPEWFRTQRKLKELVLSNANISAPLPTWLRTLPIIRKLDLSHNKLTGPLTNLPHVYGVSYGLGDILLLQNNLFRGLIPRWLCERRGLDVLDLSRNKLTGKIPKCLWNMPLEVMLLSSNRLSGVISSFLGPEVPSLRWLQLNDNNFNGELPQDYQIFTSLTVLDLGENKFSGNIPEWIGENITMLTALRLHKNNFTGRIPLSLCKSKDLQILDLAHNNLTGSIPHCFGELEGMKGNSTYMSESRHGNMMEVLKGAVLEYTTTLELLKNMDFSSNKLVGEIPKQLTALDALLGLNLSHNHFSGGIPKNIGNMKALNSLDLSANNLTGTIPPSMAALNFLSYLNLSHNNLSGQIPTGNQLQTLMDPSIYANNTYLCGPPLPKECSPHENPPTQNKSEINASEPNKVWFYLDIIYGFATGLGVTIGVLLFKKQWRHKLFMFCEVGMDKIYVAVMVRVLKIKRGHT